MTHRKAACQRPEIIRTLPPYNREEGSEGGSARWHQALLEEQTVDNYAKYHIVLAMTSRLSHPAS
ncbi:hypothetical protein E2C01_093676 [Portunus trituberculatus]|uniref:Uncharacterized protein n=1 Tax=Portunus trituberculatus TaxID=210409 RepID=A0A5B7JNB9_PORTR|nr:hypothetical protein [Portunus trituberculatus]